MAQLKGGKSQEILLEDDTGLDSLEALLGDVMESETARTSVDAEPEEAPRGRGRGRGRGGRGRGRCPGDKVHKEKGDDKQTSKKKGGSTAVERVGYCYVCQREDVIVKANKKACQECNIDTEAMRRDASFSGKEAKQFLAEMEKKLRLTKTSTV